MMTIDMRVMMLEDIGLKHSQYVSKLFKAKEAIVSSENDAPNWEGLTDPATASETVLNHARNIAINGEALANAKRAANFQINTLILEHAKNDVESYIQQLETSFDQVAGDYENNIGKLPKEIDLAVLSPEQFAEFVKVRDAAQQLKATAQMANELGIALDLGYLADAPIEFLLCGVDTLEQEGCISDSKQQYVSSETASVLPGVREALEKGAKLRMAMPHQAVEELKELGI